MARQYPDLPRRVVQKLEYLCHDPVGLADRMQNVPLCFKARVGRDFRLIFILDGAMLVPVMVYAKNALEDVETAKLLAAIEAVTRALEE